MTALSERVRRDAEQHPARPSDSGIFVAPMNRSGHGAEDAHEPASRQVAAPHPGVAKVATGNLLTPEARRERAEERCAWLYRVSHDDAGVTFAQTANDLGIHKSLVPRFATYGSGKVLTMRDVYASPEPVAVQTFERAAVERTSIPHGRTEEEQLDRVTNAVLALRTARDDAAKGEAHDVFARESRILRAIRARRCR